MKKLICIVTVTAMTLAFAACGKSDPSETQAPGTASGSPTDIEIPEATPTPQPQPVTELSICGIPVVMNGQPTGIGYLGATYSEGVLTLENVDIVAENNNRALYFSGDLEIVLKGENKITGIDVGGTSSGIYADEIDGKGSKLVISGDGSLVVSASGGTESDGIWSTGAVTVKGGSLDITGGTHAIHDKAQLTVENVSVKEQSDTHIVIG